MESVSSDCGRTCLRLPHRTHLSLLPLDWPKRYLKRRPSGCSGSRTPPSPDLVCLRRLISPVYVWLDWRLLHYMWPRRISRGSVSSKLCKRRRWHQVLSEWAVMQMELRLSGEALPMANNNELLQYNTWYPSFAANKAVPALWYTTIVAAETPSKIHYWSHSLVAS